MCFPFKKRLALISLLCLALFGISGCKSGDEIIVDLVAKAEKGDVDAMAELGETYCTARVIEQDEQSCGIWLRQAAERGHKHSQYLLGTMLEMGVGMREDPVQAYAWYKVASSQKHNMAEVAAQKLKQRMNPLQIERAQKAEDEIIARIKNMPQKNKSR